MSRTDVHLRIDRRAEGRRRRPPRRRAARASTTADVAVPSADAVLHASPLTFDASTFEIWGALLNGARLVIVPERQPSLDALADAIAAPRHHRRVADRGAVPQMVDRHVERLRAIRRVLTGGDVLSPAMAALLETRSSVRHQRLRADGEHDVHDAPHVDPPTSSDSVPIGRPIAKRRVYVLDRHRQPVPIGVPASCTPAATAGARLLDDAGADGGAIRRRSVRSAAGATALPHRRSRPLSRRRAPRVPRAARPQVKIRGFRVELGGDRGRARGSIADVVESVVGVHEFAQGPSWSPTSCPRAPVCRLTI